MKKISKKTKIIIISITVAVVILALVFGIAFGVTAKNKPNSPAPEPEKPTDDDKEHTHTFAEQWTTDENSHWHVATCEHSSEIADADEHNWDGGFIEKEATSTEEGLFIYTCLICEYKCSVIIPIGQHIHTFANDWKSDANYHWHVATCEHSYEISKKGVHEWDEGVVEIPATVTTEGEKKYTCVTCAKTKIEVIEKLPSDCEHHFDVKNTGDKFLKSPANCVSPAVYFYSCSCGEIGSETFENGLPLGHSFTKYEFNNDSTCTADGTSTAKCDRCNVTSTVTSPNSKTEHTFTQKTISSEYFVKAADCLNAEIYFYSCDCGLKGTQTFNFGEPLGHCFVNYTSNSDATCDSDGTKTAKCEYCDIRNTVADVGTMTEHPYSDAWSSNDEYHWQVATCKHSTLLGNKSIHNLVDGVVIVEPTASIEGIVQYTCSVCKKKVNVNIGVAGHTHTYSAVWSSDDTYHWNSAKCGHDLIKQNIGEHNFGEGVVTTQATHTEFGVRTFTCLDCGKQKTERLDKLTQHAFGDWQYGNVLMHKHVCECGELSIESHTWVLDESQTDDETLIYNCSVCFGTKTEYIAIKKYKVQFIDFDGTVWDEQRVLPGADAIMPIEPDRDGYRFVSWNKSYSNVQSDLKIIAQYVKTYNVEFVDYNGIVYDLQIVDSGDNAVIPDINPFRRNYRFIGWDRVVNNVTSNITVNALYIRQYSVVFVDYDGTVIKEEMVDMAGNATLPTTTPTREGYSFKGWDKSNKNINEDTVITAVYDINYYTVTFKSNGQTISTQNIRYGLNAARPVIDEIYFNWDNMAGYRFTGWSAPFDEILGDTVIEAVYGERITEPIIAVETVSVKRGNGVGEMKVSVYLVVSDTLYGLAMDLKYNSALTLTENNVKVKNGFNNNNAYTVKIDKKNNEVEFVWTQGDGVKTNNYVEVLEFTFEFDKRIASGDYLIEFLTDNYFVNNNLTKETPIVINGKISVVD